MKVKLLLLTLFVSVFSWGQATDLFISEYVEGSGNEKFIEIYNGTGASVDLSDYRLRLYANGAATPTNDVLLSGTLTNGSVIVYQNLGATLYTGITNTALNFNGDDAVALYKISTTSNVDIFGRIGNDPGAAWTNTTPAYTTVDKTLRRKSSICGGVTVNPTGTGATAFTTLSTEWDIYNIDTVSNLGTHVMSCGPAPILAITPATTNLGTSCVGTPTTAVTYTITNSGTVAASGVTVVSSGTNNTDFVVSGLSSTTIAASGGTATYVVTFTPSGTGARNATVTVASTTSGSNSPSTALTGTGATSVAQTVTTSAGGATAVLDVSATLNGNVTALGTCPATTTKGFVYSQTAVDATPTNGEPGVITTALAVGATGTFSTGVVGLTPNTGYTYRAYVYNGTTYVYGGYSTFTTSGVPVVSNGSFTGTAGTAITTFNLSTLSTNTPTSYVITSGALPTGLSLNITTGAITGTPTATGSFSIGFTASNSYGTSVTSGTVTITINPSQNSDIVAVAGSSPATLSSTINTATISTVTDGVQVWSFTIRDGGASLNDTDNLATILTALNISLPSGTASFSDIQTAAVFDGATKVSNDVGLTITATQLQFTGLNINVADNTSRILTLRISLQCPLSAATEDGDNFVFSISNVNTTFSPLGSGKFAFPAAQSATSSVNIVSVIATQLAFTTQPSVTGVSITMSNVAVTAYDACGNKDLGFTGAVTITSTGTMTGSPLSVNAVAGVATFTGITHTVVGTGFILTATATGLTSGISNPFDIVIVTVFKPGELFFVGYDGQYLGSGADDEYLVATLVPIVSGTTFSFVNSRYEAGAAANVRTNKWGGSGNEPREAPGVVNITYNGTTAIPAGSVLVFDTVGTNPSSGGTVGVFDNINIITSDSDTHLSVNQRSSFIVSLPLGGSAPNISASDPDQIYLVQGMFTFDGTDTANQANYFFNGELLHGLTNRSAWVALTSACSGATSGGATRQSRLPAELQCFNVENTSSSIVGYYENDKVHSGSLRQILEGVSNYVSNWTFLSGSSAYYLEPQTYDDLSASRTFTVSGGNPNGTWVSTSDTNWFNCSNWENFRVPDEETDVYINNGTATAAISATATFSDLYSDIAKSKNITISGSKVEITSNVNNILEVHGDLSISGTGVLDMDDSTAAADGVLKLYGDWTNSLTNDAFEEGNGTVEFLGSSAQIINNVAPTGTERFYNVKLDNDFDTSVSNDLIATGDLNVTTGNLISIDTNGFIYAYNKLTNNGTFTIENNGQLIQVNETDTNDGDYGDDALNTKFTVKRTAFVNKDDYVYWSSPVADFAVTNIPNGPRYFWNTTFLNSNGTVGNWNSYSGDMNTAVGYIVKVPNDMNVRPLPSEELPIEFKGRPNNGTLTSAIQRGSNALSIDDNWNLIGNPYPSAIFAEEFLDANVTKINGSVWVWTHGQAPDNAIDPYYDNFGANYYATDYLKYNKLGATDTTFNGIIASGQGFMVNMLHTTPSTSETVTFTNAMRTDGTASPYNNSGFYKTANTNFTVVNPEEKHRIWLTIINTAVGQKESALLGYSANSTLAVDHFYDCVYVPRTEVGIYTLVNTGEYVIQGRPLPFLDSDLVPMGVKIVNAGSHKIAIKKVDGLFEGNQEIYLEDTLLSIVHDLKAAPYTFTSEVGVFNSRFIIRYTTSALANEDFDSVNNSVTVSSQNDAIAIKSESELMSSAIVYDILGRELARKNNINANDITFLNLSALNQALIVKITLENGQVVTRKIIL